MEIKKRKFHKFMESPLILGFLTYTGFVGIFNCADISDIAPSLLFLQF